MSNSDSPIRIVLWRHGQTDWNVENRFQGHSDIALNKVGEYQVSEAAKVLAALRPDRIISSDLIRAQATAAALASLTDIKVEIDPGLRETNGGLWEGKTGPENRATHGDLFANWYEGGDEPAGVIGERRSEVAKSILELTKHHTGSRWYLAEHNAGSLPEPVFGDDAVN